MHKLAGILLILNALVAMGWWIYSSQPHKSWAFALCLAAIFAGAFLILQDRATEITIEGVGTIKSAAEKAMMDAQAIADLRERIQAQSATVDLVAEKATKAERLAAELSAKSEAAEAKLSKIDEALVSAKKSLEEVGRISQFTRTALAARNDDRTAFDQLEAWSKDPNFSFREEAANAYRSVLDQHAQPMYASGFTIPWKEGVDPATMSLASVRTTYQAAPAWLRPALIEYLWKRDDIPKIDRMTFLAEVVRSDRSLLAVEYAGRFLSEGLDSKLKPLAVKPLLELWEAKKGTIQ